MHRLYANHSIFYEGLEHLQILVSTEVGTVTNTLRIPRDNFVKQRGIDNKALVNIKCNPKI